MMLRWERVVKIVSMIAVELVVCYTLLTFPLFSFYPILTKIQTAIFAEDFHSAMEMECVIRVFANALILGQVPNATSMVHFILAFLLILIFLVWLLILIQGTVPIIVENSNNKSDIVVIPTDTTAQFGIVFTTIQDWTCMTVFISY